MVTIKEDEDEAYGTNKRDEKCTKTYLTPRKEETTRKILA